MRVCLVLALAVCAEALVSPSRVSARRVAPVLAAFEPGTTKTDEAVTVVGATGYIGKFVVRECVRRGYKTTAVVRDKAALDAKTLSLFAGAEIAEAQASAPASIGAQLKRPSTADVVICCLASRSGSKADSWAVDHQASVNVADAARAAGARHFVLLSAYCVAKPTLQFQLAKLETEAALAAQSELSYSIVRPTAFFKSVSGQVEILKGGGPFVYFDLGGGKSATCNPISESDLAMALVDCVADPARSSKGGEPVWNLGGPDVGISMAKQGDLIADAIAAAKGAERKDPWLLPVPIAVFDTIVGLLEWAARLTGSPKLADAVEFGRIGRYYAVEDMLTTSDTERYGETTLYQHYTKVAKDGQEYDPYTSVFGKKVAA